jgi:hypothetical protein
MGAAFGTDWLPAQRTVFYSFNDVVRAVAMIERAHDFKNRLAAIGTGSCIDDMMTGMALVPALFNGDLIKGLVLFCKFKLLRSPVHGKHFAKFK